MGPVFSSMLSRCHDDACEKKRRGGEAERGGERRSNRLHVRRYCYRYAPLLHVRVGTRPSLAASAKSRSATLAGGVEREREEERERPDDVLFFLSLALLPPLSLAQFEEKKTQAQPFSPRASLLSARAVARGTHGHAFLFSFHLVTIRYNYASAYELVRTCVSTYGGECRGDELKSFRGERNETRIPRANRSR